MSNAEKPAENTKPRSRQKMPWALWVFLGLLLAVIGWQQLQINQLIGPSTQIESVSQTGVESSATSKQTQQPPVQNPERQIDSSSIRGAGAETVADARRMLEQRVRAIQQEDPEITGQRMFEELQFVTGDDEASLKALIQRLILEGRINRQLQQQVANGELDQDQLALKLEELVNESESYAKEILNPEQFDRYREVRQSWRRGRAHPHAEEGES